MSDVRRISGGARAAWGARKKSGWGVSWTTLLRAFGINANHWTTAAQDEGEWRRTAEQAAKRVTAKWIAAEKARAGLRYAVVCPDVTGRTKEGKVQSKRARAGSLALVD